MNTSIAPLALAPLALALLNIAPAANVAIVQEGDAMPHGVRVVVADGARPAHGGMSHAEILRVALAAHPIRVVGAFGLSDAADAFGPFRETLSRESSWTAEQATIAIHAIYAEILAEGETSSPLSWRDLSDVAGAWRGLPIALHDCHRASLIQCFAFHMMDDKRGEFLGWPADDFLLAMPKGEREAYMRVFMAITPWVQMEDVAETLAEVAAMESA